VTDWDIETKKMRAPKTNYQPKWRHIPEDCNLHQQYLLRFHSHVVYVTISTAQIVQWKLEKDMERYGIT
jgi:hypothetical protein